MNSRVTMCIAVLAGTLAGGDLLAEPASATLDDVIVTARKREERLIDVPIAVSSYGGEALENAGIDSVAKMLGTSPSLFKVSGDFGSDSLGQQLVIRGIGATPIIEPAVGMFVDGVYQPSLGWDMDFMDIDRVEVLRGPQGTLFGRNTQGGAVNIVTQKPGQTFSAKVRVGYDQFHTEDVQASVEGPLADSTAVGLSARYQNGDGFVDNLVTGRPQNKFHQASARVRLVSALTDTLSADVSVDGSRWRGGMNGSGISSEGLQRYQTWNSDAQDSSEDGSGASLRLDWRLPWATLTSITGYRASKAAQLVDTDATAVPGNVQWIYLQQHSGSEELRLSSPSGAQDWTWTVGAYGFDEARDMSQVIIPGTSDPSFNPLFVGMSADQFYNISRTGWALFGQADRKLGAWNFGFGSRYSSERPKIDSRVNFTLPYLTQFGLDPTTDFPYGDKTSISAVTSMGSVRYSLASTSSVYATVAQGFKAGGFQDFEATPAEYTPFLNEKSISYELGLKSEWFDRRVNMNMAVFYTSITDQQIRVRVLNPFPVNRVLNIGQSHTQGAELELTTKPVRNLQVSATLSYTQTRFDKIDVPASSDPTSTIAELAGKSFPYVPKRLASMSAQYTWPIGDRRDITAMIQTRYVDHYLTTPTVIPGLRTDVAGYAVTDANVSLRYPNWVVRLYADNLLNRHIITDVYGPSFLSNGSFYSVAPPRRAGVSFTYHW